MEGQTKRNYTVMHKLFRDNIYIRAFFRSR
jgi:hypothetical protein